MRFLQRRNPAIGILCPVFGAENAPGEYLLPPLQDGERQTGKKKHSRYPLWGATYRVGVEKKWKGRINDCAKGYKHIEDTFVDLFHKTVLCVRH